MSVDEPVDLESPAEGKGPSEMLAKARQRLGLSQKEVADELYLRTSVIEYIDVGKFTSIPKPAFIKGYLRAYARVVGLFGDEIVALYQAELEVSEPTPEIKRFTEEDVGTASITGPVFQTGLIGLVGLGLVVAVIWWLVSDREEPPLRGAHSGGLQPAAQSSSEVDFGFALPPRESAASQSEKISQEQEEPYQTALDLQSERTGALRAIDSIEPGLAQTVVENREVPAKLMATEIIQEAAIEQPTSEQSASEQDIPSVADNSVRPQFSTDGTRRFVTVDASGPDKLELFFNDECWVEIEDNQLGLVYNDLNQINDVLTIYGTGPFEVLLGKATGVEMIYNGVPFELELFVGRDRTAKLTVSN